MWLVVLTIRARAVAGALMQPVLGLLTDCLGCRVVLPLFLLALVAGVLLLSSITTEAGALLYPLAVLAVILIRGFAIGGIDMAANTCINQWFITTRGRAMAISNLAQTLGQLVFYSQWYQWSVGAYHWRLTMRIAAAAVAAMVPLSMLLIRRTPESCGCQPDHRNARRYSPIALHEAGSAAAAQPAELATTLSQAMRTSALWLLCANAVVWGVLGSGFDLHMVRTLSSDGAWLAAGSPPTRWGDNSVSSRRSYTRATGPGTSAGAFPIALSLSGDDSRGFSTGCQGVLWDPRDPLS